MTDDRRLEIERRFDGELDEVGPLRPLDEAADDPEAARHLNRLIRLRQLARTHDPASETPRRVFALPDRRARRKTWWLAVGSTAAAVFLLIGSSFWTPKPNPIRFVDRTARIQPPFAEATTGRPPLEVELYGWANTPARVPQQAARLVLGPSSTTRKRSPANEILALELANASPVPRSGVQRFAVAKGSKPLPSSKPGNRPRTTIPEV